MNCKVFTIIPEGAPFDSPANPDNMRQNLTLVVCMEDDPRQHLWPRPRHAWVEYPKAGMDTLTIVKHIREQMETLVEKDYNSPYVPEKEPKAVIEPIKEIPG